MAMTPGVLGLGELDVPNSGPFQALVQMEACAVCNSTDHKLLDNEFFSGTFPVVLGHEVVGRVVDIGPGVTSFRPGDHVFRQRLSDDHVPGEGRSCWGGFAEYGLVEDVWAKQGVPYGDPSLPHDQQKLLLDVPPALATGMVTLMETLDCLATCGGTSGPVAIVGSGPVAQAFAMFAKALGAGPVYAFGRRSLYADRFATVSKADGYVVGDDYPAEVRRMIADGGFPLVLEAVGAEAALDTCRTLAGTQGRICIYGIPPASAPYRPDQLDDRTAFVGAVEGRAQQQLVDLIEAGKVDLEDWVSHTLPLTDYQRAFDMVASKAALKAVLVP
jgi:threonine dehydrogenase-like Zn-dependent dehydrogenase